MVTKLRNEITNFRQRPDESLFEAWEHYKFSTDRFPNHNMLPVTQKDTFYNGLTLRHCDTIKPPLAKPRTYMLWEPIKVVILTNLKTEVTKDTVPPTNSRSTKYVQPLVVQTETLIPNSKPIVATVAEPVVAPLSLPELTPTLMTLELADRSISRPIGVAEDVFVKVGKFHFPTDFVVVNFDVDSRVPLILRRSFLKTKRALIEVYEGELTLCVGKEVVTFNLDQTSRYSTNYNDMTANPIEVIDMACEEYSQEVLGFSDVIVSGNPTSYYDPIVSTSSSTLTPFGDSDFLLEEVDAFLALEDDPTSLEVDHSYYDMEGDILLLEAFINDDPSNPTCCYDPIVSTSSSTLTPFGDSDFLLEEVDAFLALEDDPTSLEVDHSYYDTEGDILLLEAFINDDPSLPPPTQGMHLP
nr:reverse transcriptase domain-containing protein [Tanacetum cinerariifolium]